MPDKLQPQKNFVFDFSDGKTLLYLQKKIILSETNFFCLRDHTCRLLIPKIIVKMKIF